jgi:hypothetical protein
VINTAPTGRQAVDIMMSEIATIYRKAKVRLGGTLLTRKIKFAKREDWFLEVFKGDDDIEAWSGFHSPNIMVAVTEASGVSDLIFETMEGILQNNSRLMIMFNPNKLSGEAYKSTKSTRYEKLVLNDLNAPNVLNWLRWKRGEISFDQMKKIHIRGQVDGEWVNDKVLHAGWTHEITKEQMKVENYDFEWLGKFYRPDDRFRVKVLGQFPEEDESTLIPMPWLEAAVQRWNEWAQLKEMDLYTKKKIGSDIAGDGHDNTVHLFRHGDLVSKIYSFGKQDHMAAAGWILAHKNKNDWSIIDTIGEGAGVFSRLKELKTKNIVSMKNSFGAAGLKDYTGELQFANMKSYLYWAVRDWLNPQFNSNAMLPPDDELIQELNAHTYSYQSNGKIVVCSKDDVKTTIGRSPDKSDALTMTFAPERMIKKPKRKMSKRRLGIAV